jgi:hydroxymethylbilane synthase
MAVEIKLGTRRSLLAWAQSSWVAREIEKLNPGTRVELVGIDTRGDKIVDVSLRTVAGKEFFVAELDDALRAGQVDMTVHSMKDLSLERPADFVLAAIPPRENARDVVLFGPGVREKIASGKILKIGTSSPRRIENIPPFLAKALPTVEGRAPLCELVEIRGNVNTRLGRVHEPAGNERALDGVVLAFAGLIRLWNDDAGRKELSKLLTGVRWMILPLRESPAAPAQGALAIECRADNKPVREALAKLHDFETEARVSAERQLLADWGGGCHQKFGATAVQSKELGTVLYIRGRKPDETFVDEIRWAAPSSSGRGAGVSQAWDGSEYRARSEKDGEASAASSSVGALDLNGRAVFVAHARALPKTALMRAQGARVWTSGVPSWFKLASQGVWVEGCAEGLGFDTVARTLGEPVLQLPVLGAEWTVLTHDAAHAGWAGWNNVQVVATYSVGVKSDPSERKRIEEASHFYWSSGSQFDQYGAWAKAGSQHSCGAGKTAAHLRERGLSPIVFPSVEEWRKWLKN